jgi:hypothetical protein
MLGVPPRSRTVKIFSWPQAPVEIVGVIVRGKPVHFGKAFPERDRWIGELRVRIKNVSAKRVSWVRVALKFLKNEEPGSRLSDFMTYGIGRTDIEKLRGGGPPLKPGETAEVSYSWEQYQSVREILDGMGYPRSITLVEVSVDKVIFEGEPDVMWIEGKMNKQNPNGPGWIPIKP